MEAGGVSEPEKPKFLSKAEAKEMDPPFPPETGYDQPTDNGGPPVVGPTGLWADADWLRFAKRARARWLAENPW